MREWAVVDSGRTIHIEGAESPADVMASVHGFGTLQVGVSYRDDRGPWVAL